MDLKTGNTQNKSLWSKIEDLFFYWLRIDTTPQLKIYTGFSNGKKCMVIGHALNVSPTPRNTYRNSFLYNTLALVRLFIIRPMKNMPIEITINNQVFSTRSERDGFFSLDCTLDAVLPAGIHQVSGQLFHRTKNTLRHSATADIMVPDKSDFSCISDIDDTFLISHSANLRKRLFVLFTKNARTRKPYDGAVNHYSLLAGPPAHQKSFFYVSSSEWNLYPYIREFINTNTLPKGVFLLNQIKTFSKLFATGQSNHHGKFTRIVKIIDFFPQQKFILLGDDSQRDPYIYDSVVHHFPKNIICVYIRRVHTPVKKEVEEIGEKIKSAGIEFLYFSHSEEAMAHSLKRGYNL